MAMPRPNMVMTNGIPIAVHRAGTGPAAVLLLDRLERWMRPLF